MVQSYLQSAHFQTSGMGTVWNLLRSLKRVHVCICKIFYLAARRGGSFSHWRECGRGSPK